MTAPPGLLLAVGGPAHGRRLHGFADDGPCFYVDRGRRHGYRPQRIEGIQGVPVVLMHESITGPARLTTYACAVTIERDALLQAADEIGLRHTVLVEAQFAEVPA